MGAKETKQAKLQFIKEHYKNTARNVLIEMVIKEFKCSYNNALERVLEYESAETASVIKNSRYKDEKQKPRKRKNY